MLTLSDAIASIATLPLPAEVEPDQGSTFTTGETSPQIADVSVARAQLGVWLTRVDEWNRKIDLTAARTAATLAELGVLDAWHLAGRIATGPEECRGERKVRLVDVGCGFGAPGLPLAILRPDLHVTLVEPLGKRVAFLRFVVGELGLVGRIEVVQSKGESLADAGTMFDVAISRATLSPPQWLALGDRLAPHGEVVVLVAREPMPAQSNRRLEWTATYGTQAGAERHIGSYRRVREMP